MRMTIPVSPGDFFDRLIILVNKVYLCEKKEDIQTAIIQICELCNSITEPLSGIWWDKAGHSVKELRDSNKQLWDLESLVRTLKDAGERLIVSDQIREVNAQRAEAKACIDAYLGGLKEVKDYAISTE